MIRQKRFQAALFQDMDEERPCLQPLNMPWATEAAGRKVAHDLLEHAPGDDGSIMSELTALGSSLWIHRDRVDRQSDYARQVSLAMIKYSSAIVPPVPAGILRWCEFQGIVQRELAFLKAGVPAADILDWMTLGWQRAIDQFGRGNSEIVYEALIKVTNDVDAFLHQHISADTVGSEVIVTVDFGDIRTTNFANQRQKPSASVTIELSKSRHRHFGDSLDILTEIGAELYRYRFDREAKEAQDQLLRILLPTLQLLFNDVPHQVGAEIGKPSDAEFAVRLDRSPLCQASKGLQAAIFEGWRLAGAGNLSAISPNSRFTWRAR